MSTKLMEGRILSSKVEANSKEILMFKKKKAKLKFWIEKYNWKKKSLQKVNKMLNKWKKESANMK